MPMDERFRRVVLSMEEPRHRTQYHDRGDPRADQDRQRNAAEMHEGVIAVLHVERPDEPQRHHDEHREPRPRVGERIAEHLQRFARGETPADQFADRTRALQDQDRDHDVAGERHHLHQREMRGVVQTERLRDLRDRGTDADHGDDPHHPALHESRPCIAHAQQTQARCGRLQEKAADDHDHAAQHIDVDQRIERAVLRRAVVGEDRHQRARRADEYR
jgi:hypothetical protein